MRRGGSMEANIGRAGRLLAGGLLLGLYGALETPYRYFTLLGLVLIGTAMTGWCPLYALFRLSTRRAGPGAGFHCRFNLSSLWRWYCWSGKADMHDRQLTVRPVPMVSKSALPGPAPCRPFRRVR